MVIDEVVFTLEQTAEHAALQVVRIGYAYTIRDPQTASYDASIDIIGDDLLRDDVLASGVDGHRVQCNAGRDKRIERSLIVAQGLLDEDVHGDDEIKLCIKVGLDGETPVTVMTPVIHGQF